MLWTLCPVVIRSCWTYLLQWKILGCEVFCPQSPQHLLRAVLCGDPISRASPPPRRCFLPEIPRVFCFLCLSPKSQKTVCVLSFVCKQLQVKSIWGRLHLRCVEAGNELGNLFPTHTRHWWPIAEDVFMRKDVQNTSGQHRAYASIKFWIPVCFYPATVAMSIKGQASYCTEAVLQSEIKHASATIKLWGASWLSEVMQGQYWSWNDKIKGEKASEVAQALQRSMSPWAARECCMWRAIRHLWSYCALWNQFSPCFGFESCAVVQTAIVKLSMNMLSGAAERQVPTL